MKNALLCLLLFLSIYSKAQVTLSVVRYDTVQAKPFQANKVVAYQYNDLIIFLDYDSIKKYGQSLCHPKAWLSGTAKTIMNRLEKEVAANDTGYLDQADFLKLNWIPFDTFLCSQIQEGACIIRDSNGVMHQTFILAYANRKDEHSYLWYRILFFLPGQTKSFIERTLVES